VSTLVTGGTGFVGINIVRDLAANGHHVVSVDVGPPDALAERYLAPWADRVTWVTGDACDPAVLDGVAAAHDLDLVVHAAAYTPYEDQERTHFRHTMDNNVTMMLNVLDLVARVAPRRTLLVSTIGVYTAEYFTEPTEHVLVREDQPVAPDHVYGISKIASEALLRRHGHVFGHDVVAVRLAQNWGPMERVTPYHARMSIPYVWARDAARGTPIEASPFGAGIANGRRLNQDHPYVLDTAAAIRLLLEAETLRHDLYNVSAGGPVFVDDMLAAMDVAEPAATYAAPIGHDSAATSPGVAFDTTRLVADAGFAPAFDLAAALAHTIAWRREVGFLGD
jgi:UDP-glucose 4-epimerase